MSGFNMPPGVSVNDIPGNERPVKRRGERDPAISKAIRRPWLIWSNEHKAWWAPGRMGYVTSRAKAGRYSFSQALEIVRNANQLLTGHPNEAMVEDVT